MLTQIMLVCGVWVLRLEGGFDLFFMSFIMSEMVVSLGEEVLSFQALFLFLNCSARGITPVTSVGLLLVGW